MKFIELEFWTNEDKGLILIRPNKINAIKKGREFTKLYIEGFPNAIAVHKPYEELKEELERADLRTKVQVRKNKGNTKKHTRPDAED